MVKCLVFDIFGDFAFFKKFYTTSSPLTYDIPPKTVLTGVIGAILGLSFEEKYNLFKSQIGLRIINPISKVYLGINWLNTKARNSINLLEKEKKFLESVALPPKANIAAFLGMRWPGQSPHTQANLELIKDPNYRIYYPEQNPFFTDLVMKIQTHTAYYTPFFGSSEFLCNFKCKGFYDLNKVENNSTLVEISCVIPAKNIDLANKNSIDFSHSNLYKINTPYVMISGRIVKEYIDILYNPLGKTLKLVPDIYYELIDKDQKVVENIVFF